MDDSTSPAEVDTGQVITLAAEVYENFFVPALFAQFTGPVLSAAKVAPGDRLLDVACGTGVLARAARDSVGRDGTVTGLDLNPAMLAVARRTVGVDWRQGAAERLPFEGESFDVVVSQFGLMFFVDRAAALSEMARVLEPNGRAAIAVWASLDENPGYAAMVNLLDRLFGKAVADALRAPFALGDRQLVADLVTCAGFRDVEVAQVAGTARFSSLEAWMHTDIRGWTLADRITDEEFVKLLEHACRDLAHFVGDDGEVAFAAPALVVTGCAPE